MTYSFSARAATKEEFLAKVAQEFENVLKYQPSHSKDAGPVKQVISSFLDILESDQEKDFYGNVSGSLNGHWNKDIIDSVTSVQLSVVIGLAPKL